MKYENGIYENDSVDTNLVVSSYLDEEQYDIFTITIEDGLSNNQISRQDVYGYIDNLDNTTQIANIQLDTPLPFTLELKIPKYYTGIIITGLILGNPFSSGWGCVESAHNNIELLNLNESSYSGYLPNELNIKLLGSPASISYYWFYGR